jgi:SAM-dependent methyltransferase
MPVTAGRRQTDISQREQYAKGGVGRWYWDCRDRAALSHVVGPRILDAGCGEGVTLEKLARLFPHGQAEGVDVDPANVEICRGCGLDVKESDLCRLPYPDASFDTCVLMEVIEHLERPEDAVRELARVTRPGGRIIVVYPNDRLMFAARVAFLKFREARFDPGHLRRWNGRDLKRLMGRCGFQATLSRGIPLSWPLMLHGLVVGERTA